MSHLFALILITFYSHIIIKHSEQDRQLYQWRLKVNIRLVGKQIFALKSARLTSQPPNLCIFKIYLSDHKQA